MGRRKYRGWARIREAFCQDGQFRSGVIGIAILLIIVAAAPLLADQRFYLCGASYVLNFQHVSGVNGQAALLDDGQTVMLPRTVAAEFKKAWGGYWLEENGKW